jgi:hypothetical protein
VVLGAILFASSLSLFPTAPVSAADRFGEAYQAEVIVDGAVTHPQPNPGSPPVGPLGKGAIVMALNDQIGADGRNWTATNVGWLPAQDLTELFTPWVAEVTTPTVSVYAYPDAKGPIRLTDNQGDFLRVTGVSMGVNGDDGIWWATTQGYVKQGTIKQSASPWALGWKLPDASEAPNGWWGETNDDAHVRLGPNTDAPVVGDLPGGSRVKVLGQQNGEDVDGNNVWYTIDGGRFAGAWVHSSLIDKIDPPKANTTPPPGQQSATWIVVDRTNASLTFVDHGQAKFVTYVSLGVVGRNTPTGVYTTNAKFRFDRMTSRSLPINQPGYDLPNVPFTQYFTNMGAAIHGTYWHDEFGIPQSHGCINVTWTDGAYLFNLTSPTVSGNQNSAWDDSTSATPVYILN